MATLGFFFFSFSQEYFHFLMINCKTIKMFNIENLQQKLNINHCIAHNSNFCKTFYRHQKILLNMIMMKCLNNIHVTMTTQFRLFFLYFKLRQYAGEQTTRRKLLIFCM